MTLGAPLVLLCGGVVIRVEGCPGIALHVFQQRALPCVLRVRGEERFGEEVFAAGASAAGVEGHVFDQRTVRSFCVDCAAGFEGGTSPLRDAARREVEMAAERSLIGSFLVAIGVEVIGEEFFGELCVDLSFVLRHERIPAFVAGVHGA